MLETIRALGPMIRREGYLRWERALARPYWALALLIATLASLAVFSSSPGWYVTDNRFEHFWSPWRVALRSPSLWDFSRGMGGPRGELALAYGAVLALLRGLGTSPAVAERLWHVGLLTVAGTGMAAFLRTLRPRFGAEHVLAGIFYSFNPYSAVFLVPSGLFLHYALAPWLLVTFVRGVREERPWRWAAIFAVLVWASGTLDPPGLAYSLLLLAPTAAYLVLVERSGRWTEVARWLVRAGLLSAIVSAPVLMQLWSGSASLAARLLGTESVEAVQRTTSWAESWRGLGFWPSYFPQGGGLLRDQHAGYVAHPGLVLTTFLPPLIALAVLGWSRWRPRLVLGAIALMSLTLMVGPYPPESPLPFGQILLDAYERFPALTAMRTGYKAGAGWAIGTAGLLGVAAVGLATRLRTTMTRALPLAVVGALIGVVSLPYWTGAVYSPDDRTRGVPEYWFAALDWLDRQPGSTRALVVPGTSNTRYRWGSPGDDIFDALLARPHIVHTSFPQSTAVAFDLEGALDGHLQSGRYRRGTLAPMARRLGIEYVIVRNDLNWQELGKARPATLQELRDDPDLDQVGAFGRPGENVVAPGDRSGAALAEARLTPVEIFRVAGSRGLARLVPSAPPLLVAGDGEAWPLAAAQGLLDDGRPLRYSAYSRVEELDHWLVQGAPVIMTDTNRRRVTVLTRYGQIESHTLTADEDLGRAPTNLFGQAGAATVAAFGDAEGITSPSVGDGPSGYEPWFRPANAFDGDPRTSWLTGTFEDPVGRSVKVTFEEVVELSEVSLRAARSGAGERAVTAVSVHLSDGSVTLVDLGSGEGEAQFNGRPTTSLEVRIEAVEGAGSGPVGLSEVVVPPLDLAEKIQLPDDLFRLADENPSIRQGLIGAPVRYLFEREIGRGPSDVEAVLRRRFRAIGTRPYDLDAALTVDAATPDRVVDALIGDRVGGYGTERFEGSLQHRGGLAVDGRRETGWVAPGHLGGTLTVRFPPRSVDQVRITSPVTTDRSTVHRVKVTVAGMEQEVEMTAPPRCQTTISGAERCEGEATVSFPGVAAEQVAIEVTGLRARALGTGQVPSPYEISEVTVGREGWPPERGESRRCADGALSIDQRTVPVRRLGSRAGLLAGQPVDFEACGPVELAEGWHEIVATALVRVDSAVLATGDAPPPFDEHSTGEAVGLDAGGPASALRMGIDVPDGEATLVLGQAYDPRWSASVNGRELGPARPLDAQSAWTIPPVDSGTVEFRYRPQQWYQGALAMSWAGLALCLWLALRRPRGCADRRSRGPSGPPAKPARAGNTASVSSAEPTSFGRARLFAHALRR